jgi:hypothetical protein
MACSGSNALVACIGAQALETSAVAGFERRRSARISKESRKQNPLA